MLQTVLNQQSPLQCFYIDPRYILISTIRIQENYPNLRYADWPGVLSSQKSIKGFILLSNLSCYSISRIPKFLILWCIKERWIIVNSLLNKQTPPISAWQRRYFWSQILTLTWIWATDKCEAQEGRETSTWAAQPSDLTQPRVLVIFH